MQHSFDVDLAQKVGVPAAIVLNALRYWIEKNAANGKHLQEGRYWTYNSTKALTLMFPYWTKWQIHSTIEKLVKDGYVMKGCFNESVMDRTSWYALTDLGIEVTNCCGSKIQIKVADEPKKEADADTFFGLDTEWVRVVKCYETNIGLIPIGTAGDELMSFYDDMKADLVCKAIEITNQAQPSSPWPYLKKVLNTWAELGIKTVEQAAAYCKDLERKADARKQSYAQPTKEPPAIEGNFY